MLNDLESLAVQLHECLAGLQHSEDARSIVSDIIHICGENINPHTISQYRN